MIPAGGDAIGRDEPLEGQMHGLRSGGDAVEQLWRQESEPDNPQYIGARNAFALPDGLEGQAVVGLQFLPPCSALYDRFDQRAVNRGRRAALPLGVISLITPPRRFSRAATVSMDASAIPLKSS